MSSGFRACINLWPVVLVGTAAYATAVQVLLVAGKRALVQWRAFHLVVPRALGSTLVTIPRLYAPRGA